MNNLNECDSKVQFISLSKANQSVKNLQLLSYLDKI